MSSPLISVIVCTYRRPELVEKFLPSVCAQELDGAAFEVIVVDNNSRDCTRDVVTRLQLKFTNLRYAFEPEQGLCAARNRGWRESRGKYVAYLDDECRTPPGWLAIAREVIERHAPLEFGGPILGFYEGEKPDWWRTEYDRDHTFRYAVSGGFLPSDQEIYGGNLFLSRRALESLGGFDRNLGMRGGQLGYGEEWDLHLRLTQAVPGHLSYYEPRLYVKHLVRAEKLSLVWRFREQLVRGRFSHWIGCGGRPLYSLWESIWLPARVAGEFVRAGLKASSRDRDAYPSWRNYFYENDVLFRSCNQLGQLRAQWSAAPRWRGRTESRANCRCGLDNEFPSAGRGAA